MKHGPALSNVFDLINFGSLSEKIGSWSSMISNPSGYDVSLEREISEEDFEGQRLTIPTCSSVAFLVDCGCCCRRRHIRFTAFINLLYSFPLTNHFSLLTPCRLHAGPSCFKAWRYEPTEFTFDEFGESDWRTILQVGSNDLNTDRQTGFRTTHWNHRCRETWERSHSGPNR
jgi:hypothetical protein